MKKRIISMFIAVAMVVAGLSGIMTPMVSANTGDWSYRLTNDGSEAEIARYTGSGGNVTIPDTLGEYSVTSIGYDAFRGCTNLTSITIPGSVKSIGYDAFRGCTSLTSIIIPDSVKSIGYDAFRGCTSLTSIIIPDSVKSIGSYAFEGCTSLTSITIPDSVTSIGSSAFSGCIGLTSVTIPDSVTNIGEWAFSGCPIETLNIDTTKIPNLRFVKSSLKKLTIGNSVTNIGDSAFDGCTNLTSITIPDSVTSIGEWAFSDCTSLTAINVHPDNLAYSSVDGVLFNKDKSEILQYPIGKTATSYSIPDSVTSIGVGAFGSCTSLASIIIPDSVTSIGGSAFYGTAWLNNQPDGVVYAGKVTYTYKGDMPDNTSITLRTDTKGIAEWAFSGCESLTSITIPDSVTSIGDGVFFYCTSLTSITIPDSVTSIGYEAFHYCASLTSIIIPDSVTSIGEFAFGRCESLASIIIPDSVTSIGDYAFGSTSLVSIIIPDSVTSIGDYAFGYPIGKGTSKIEGFIIYGVEGSAAETYAIENEFKFREIGGEYCTCNNCEDCGFLGGVYGLGKVRGKEKVEIGDAVEILCYLAELPSVITADENAQIAALITPASRASGKPTIQDAVQILCFLAKLSSMLG